jgi:hypothetical protein
MLAFLLLLPYALQQAVHIHPSILNHEPATHVRSVVIIRAFAIPAELATRVKVSTIGFGRLVKRIRAGLTDENEVFNSEGEVIGRDVAVPL